MNEERQMILRMLKEGKISVEEADALLRTLEDEEAVSARSEPVEETRPGGAHSFAEFGADLGSAIREIVGDIELSVPSGARASIDAAVRTGRISSTLSLAQVTSDRRSLRGILNEPGAKVAMRTVSGNIDITGHET